MFRAILPHPRHDPLGRLLGRCGNLPVLGVAATRWQRVRRKRFVAAINRGDHEPLQTEILRHTEGQRLQDTLSKWLLAGGPCAAFPEPAPGTHSHPSARRCSVIINTVDRASELEITLADLRKLWNSELDELIVVLGPTADTSESAIGAAGIPHTLVRCPDRNLALSRNLGLMAATGTYVAYLDDDASPEPGWLESLIAALENEPTAAVAAGFVLDSAGARFLDRYVVSDTLGRSVWCETMVAAEAAIAGIGPQRAFLRAVGCNMAFRRDALLAHNGFDPAYRYFLEETDMVRRLGLSGGRCVAAPDSRVRHRLGQNPARARQPPPDERLTILRSLLHYLGKFAFGSFPAAVIEACVWQRLLLDLEKIAWGQDHPAAAQADYLTRCEAHLAQAINRSTCPPSHAASCPGSAGHPASIPNPW